MIVVVGPGLIGQAIARRVGVGKHVLLADLRPENAVAAAETLGNAGNDATVDVSSRQAVQALVGTATGLGAVTGVIHAAGVSPSQASPGTILAVDLNNGVEMPAVGLGVFPAPPDVTTAAVEEA